MSIVLIENAKQEWTKNKLVILNTSDSHEPVVSDQMQQNLDYQN